MHLYGLASKKLIIKKKVRSKEEVIYMFAHFSGRLEATSVYVRATRVGQPGVHEVVMVGVEIVDVHVAQEVHVVRVLTDRCYLSFII